MSEEGEGTVTITPSEVTLEGRTSDPSLVKGRVWYRDDLASFRAYARFRPKSFASPSTSPRGVGLDSDNCIWNVDGGTDKIYKLDQTGSVVTSFASPGGGPYGVGVDSGDCIWNADLAANRIYRLDQTGSIVSVGGIVNLG